MRATGAIIAGLAGAVAGAGAAIAAHRRRRPQPEASPPSLGEHAHAGEPAGEQDPRDALDAARARLRARAARLAADLNEPEPPQ